MSFVEARSKLARLQIDVDSTLSCLQKDEKVHFQDFWFRQHKSFAERMLASVVELQNLIDALERNTKP